MPDEDLQDFKWQKIEKMNLKVYGLSEKQIKSFQTEQQIITNH